MAIHIARKIRKQRINVQEPIVAVILSAAFCAKVFLSLNNDRSSIVL